ncbi:MAG: hypothetical protein PHN45_09480, partial [Methylococcales bacterium]|nr:hypothetical protein [Methylococcales bacterium]
IDDSTEPFKYSYDDPFRFDSNTMTKETIRVHNEEMIEKIRLSKSNSTVIKKLLPKMIAIIDVMNRDLDFGFIKPYAEKDDVYYFKSCDFIDWAISKGFDVPVELKEFAESKIDDGPPVETQTTTAPPVQPKEKISINQLRDNDFLAWIESENPPLDKMAKPEIHERLRLREKEISIDKKLWSIGDKSFDSWFQQQEIHKPKKGRKTNVRRKTKTI